MQSQISGVPQFIELVGLPVIPAGQGVTTQNRFAAAFDNAKDHATTQAMRPVDIALAEQPAVKSAFSRDAQVESSSRGDANGLVSQVFPLDQSLIGHSGKSSQRGTGKVLLVNSVSPPALKQVPILLDKLPTQNLALTNAHTPEITANPDKSFVHDVVTPAPPVGLIAQVVTSNPSEKVLASPGDGNAAFVEVVSFNLSPPVQAARTLKKVGNEDASRGTSQSPYSSPFIRKNLVAKAAGPNLKTNASAESAVNCLVIVPAMSQSISPAISVPAVESGTALSTGLAHGAAVPRPVKSAFNGMPMQQPQASKILFINGTAEKKAEREIPEDATAASQADALQPSSSSTPGSGVCLTLKEAAGSITGSIAVLIPISTPGHITVTSPGPNTVITADSRNTKEMAATSGAMPASPRDSLSTPASGMGLPYTMLSTTPTTLEVGIASGTHGWLKIRAELTAPGEVSASLTGASATVLDKLRSELPALNSYLQREQVQVNAVTVHAVVHTPATPGDAGAGAANGASDRFGSGSSSNYSGGTASGGQAQHEAADRNAKDMSGLSGSVEMREVPQNRLSNLLTYEGAAELGDSGSLSSVEYKAGGGWLNVRV